MSQESAPEVPVEAPKTIPQPPVPIPDVTDTSSSSTHVPIATVAVSEPTPIPPPVTEVNQDTIIKPIETTEQPKTIEPPNSTPPPIPVQNETKPTEAPKPSPPQATNVPPTNSPARPVAKAAIASTGLLSNLYLPSKYKVIFLGDMSTGKTSIIARFMYNSFDRQEHTIGIDFLSKTIALEDRSVRLQLWDTAGQERYRALISAYIRESQAAVLVYDITHRPSFDSLDKWAEDVRKECGDDVLLLIVGNKSDLSSKRTVTKEEGEAKAQQLRTLFIETSAKTGAQVQQLFNKLAAALPAGNASAPLSAPGPAPPPPSTTNAGFGLAYPTATTGSARRCMC